MVYILLGSGFEEAEALVTADVLRRGGVPVALTGIGGDMVSGAHGIAVSTDTAVERVALVPGDAVVLPGGLGGVNAIENSPAAMALVRQAGSEGAIQLAAICAAPALLARAGVIGPGARAVCYPGMEAALLEAGVTHVPGRSAVHDGALISGRAPGAAFDFSLTLLEALTDSETAQGVRAELCCG